jgi:hypothetical protein
MWLQANTRARLSIAVLPANLAFGGVVTARPVSDNSDSTECPRIRLQRCFLLAVAMERGKELYENPNKRIDSVRET